MNKRLFVLFAMTILVVVGLAAALWPMASLSAQAEPAKSRGSVSLYSGAAITTTAYSSEPYIAVQWKNVDVWATVDISGSGNIVLTVQESYDGDHWADAFSEYLATNTTITATASTTSTETTTATVSSSWTTRTRNKTIAADGTYYIPDVQVSGNYMRVKMVPSTTVTPTLRLVLKDW